MDYRGHFGLHVDYVRFKMPVAMLLVDWEPAADRDLHGYRFGDLLLRSMKKTTKARKSKTMPNVWHTEGVNVRFGYRDGRNDETLYLNVECPSYWEQATAFQPLTPAEQEEFRRDGGKTPAIIYDGVLSDADKYWWPWKVAYQKNGFFLLAHATYLPVGSIKWKLNWDKDTPILAIKELDFMEIASWEKIAFQTEQAKQTVDERARDINGVIDIFRQLNGRNKNGRH